MVWKNKCGTWIDQRIRTQLIFCIPVRDGVVSNCLQDIFDIHCLAYYRIALKIPACSLMFTCTNDFFYNYSFHCNISWVLCIFFFTVIKTYKVKKKIYLLIYLFIYTACNKFRSFSSKRHKKENLSQGNR